MIPAPIPRQQWSPLAHRLSLVLVYLLLWPIFKLLEMAGRWPQRILPKAIKQLYVWPADYTPGASDVIVSSYFKSGTNWMLQITTQIAWRGKAEFAHVHDLVPWPEFKQRLPFAVNVRDVDPGDIPTGLRIIKSHFAPGVVPLNDQARYICVVRDPRAVFESSYSFMRNVSMGPLMPSVARWLDLYLSDAAVFGSWADFTAACWALRDRHNVLFVTYEQLKQDLPAQVARIADFMGVTLTEVELQSVVEQASFAHMKRIGHKFDAVGVGPPWATPQGAMIRKGTANGAAELLPGANARILHWCRQRLQQLHSDFPFDACYGDDDDAGRGRQPHNAMPPVATIAIQGNSESAPPRLR